MRMSAQSAAKAGEAEKGDSEKGRGQRFRCNNGFIVSEIVHEPMSVVGGSCEDEGVDIQELRIQPAKFFG